jgi:hypothetical protein
MPVFHSCVELYLHSPIRLTSLDEHIGDMVFCPSVGAYAVVITEQATMK